jgi:hypothetical protein
MDSVKRPWIADEPEDMERLNLFQHNPHALLDD